MKYASVLQAGENILVQLVGSSVLIVKIYY